MADAEATGLIKVKADTSQAVRATNDLTDSQKKLGQAVEASASKFDKMIGAGKSAFSGLGEALQGLNAGLMVADKVATTIDKAVDAQLVEKAKQFGIQVKNASQATEELHKALAKSPTALDETTRGLLKTRDTLDGLGKSLQELINGVVVPAVTLLSDGINLLTRRSDARRQQAEQDLRDAQAKGAGLAFRADLQSAGALGGVVDYDRRARAVGAPGYSDQDYASALLGDVGGTIGTGAISPITKAAKAKGGIPVVIVGVESGGGMLGGVYSAGRDIEGSLGARGAYDQFGNPVGAVGSADGIDTSKMTNPLDVLRQQGTSFKGDPRQQELADQLNDTTSAAGAAFATLSGGLTAAVDAAITSSDSITRAAAKASAGVLKSLAVEAAGRAAFEGALAIGSLAIGDARSAATHGLAAAKFAAVAGLEGSLAAGLGALASSGGGGGGGGSSAGAPAGGFGSPTGGSSGGGNITVNVTVGYGFDGDAAKLGATLARTIRSAQLQGRTRTNYTTEVSG
jgi:hypothetical protein